MKAKKLLSIVALTLTVMGLGACRTTSKAGSTATSSTSTSQASSSSSSSSTETTSSSSSSSSSSDSTAVTNGSMDIEAIANGDFSSIKGTWKNAAGYTIVFNETGLASTDSQLSGPYTIESGLLQTNMNSIDGPGYALMMVPAGVSIPDQYFSDGSDPSDISRDRMYGAQGILSINQLSPLYRLNDSTDPVDASQYQTSVSLESGQVTFDYAIEILGDRSWTIIQDNYNRTESVPYTALQAENGVIYQIYQNGVILDINAHLVYLPS